MSDYWIGQDPYRMSDYWKPKVRRWGQGWECEYRHPSGMLKFELFDTWYDAVRYAVDKPYDVDE